MLDAGTAGLIVAVLLIFMLTVGVHIGVALGLTDALQDDLFGGLRSNAAEVAGFCLNVDDVSQFGFRLHLLCIR